MIVKIFLYFLMDDLVINTNNQASARHKSGTILAHGWDAMFDSIDRVAHFALKIES